jgi:hypothetical protein
MVQLTVMVVKGPLAVFWQALPSTVGDPPPAEPPAMVWTKLRGAPPAGWAKSTETDVFWFIVTTQVEVVVQPLTPVQATKVQDPPVQEAEGVSVKVTTVPWG